jgi:hypothetical protein
VVYGKDLAAKLKTQGLTGPKILGPLREDLNAQTNMSAHDKATAARVACASQGTTWGPGPVVAMPNGDFVVTPRAANPTGPVLIVKPDGTVVRGNANVELDGLTYKVSNVTERK